MSEPMTGVSEERAALWKVLREYVADLSPASEAAIDEKMDALIAGVFAQVYRTQEADGRSEVTR